MGLTLLVCHTTSVTAGGEDATQWLVHCRALGTQEQLLLVKTQITAGGEFPYHFAKYIIFPVICQNVLGGDNQ